MNVARTVLIETKRTLDLRGRTARAPYLIFLFVAVMLFASILALLVQLTPAQNMITAVVVTILLFYLPVTTAGMRRLHDVGESGSLMFTPLAPLAAFAVFLGLIALWVSTTAAGNIAAFISAFFFAKLLAAGTLLAALVLIAITMMHFSHTMGLLLLPSQPGQNAHGPNPHEVSQ